MVNPGVSGKVTLKLNEVPWDQALDLILKANGLGYTLEGNVIRIARLADLQREEQELRKLQEEKALAGNLEVFNKTLSYAKATEMSETVKKVALSARGTITLDPRTNTMIITDLPANIAKARDLIAELDRATPQVEIEARIVVT
ncbi:MAG: type IV pilus secretin PilQ, partial [Acidobacteria bacterium]